MPGELGTVVLRKLSPSEQARTGKKFNAHVVWCRQPWVNVSFGASGYDDYTTHKDPVRKERYLSRHEARENWYDLRTAGALSRWLLWNKPTLAASIADVQKRFGVHVVPLNF